MCEISGLMDQIAGKDGFTQTALPGVKLFKASETLPRRPLCYEQGILFVGQGSKRVFLGKKAYEYNPENYLVLTVPLPVECETGQVPFTALMVDINLSTLNRIIDCMDTPDGHALPDPNAHNQGIFLARHTREMQDALLRLLRALASDVESKVMGPGIVQELIFRVMRQENAAPLHALATKHTALSKVDNALRHIHGNYQQAMNIDQLAGLVHMSPTAFHKAFKEVTASSPIQYLKKIRLDKAKRLLMNNRMRVNEAAAAVGYESATQFSREFRRHFGKPPVRFMNNRHENV